MLNKIQFRKLYIGVAVLCCSASQLFAAEPVSFDDPRVLSQTAITSDKQCYQMDVSNDGKTAYIACRKQNPNDPAYVGVTFYIYDISDVHAPKKISETALGDVRLMQLIVRNGLAFIFQPVNYGHEPSNYKNEAVIMDVHDALHPAIIGKFDYPVKYGLHLFNGAKVSDDGHTVVIKMFGFKKDLSDSVFYDVSDPSHPHQIDGADRLEPPSVLLQLKDQKFEPICRIEQVVSIIPISVASSSGVPEKVSDNNAKLVAKGKEAVERKDFKSAVRWYEQAAKWGGDVSAMYELGQIYSDAYGYNVVKHAPGLRQAEKWYRQAADHGNPAGMYWMGFYYYTTHPTTTKPEDWTASLPWFQKAADLEYAPAITQLGVMYNSDGSFGVPEDHAKATQLFLKAANMGDVQAMNNLAVNYNQGKGVAKDHDEATRWWRKAAALGDKNSKEWLRLNGDK